MRERAFITIKSSGNHSLFLLTALFKLRAVTPYKPAKSLSSYLPFISQSSRNHAPARTATRNIHLAMLRRPGSFSGSCESDSFFFIVTSFPRLFSRRLLVPGICRGMLFMLAFLKSRPRNPLPSPEPRSLRKQHLKDFVSRGAAEFAEKDLKLMQRSVGVFA